MIGLDESRTSAFALRCSEHSLEGDEHSQVISVVIRDEERFAQDSLTIAVRDSCEEVC